MTVNDVIITQLINNNDNNNDNAGITTVSAGNTLNLDTTFHHCTAFFAIWHTTYTADFSLPLLTTMYHHHDLNSEYFTMSQNSNSNVDN